MWTCTPLDDAVEIGPDSTRLCAGLANRIMGLVAAFLYAGGRGSVCPAPASTEWAHTRALLASRCAHAWRSAVLTERALIVEWPNTPGEHIVADRKKGAAPSAPSPRFLLAKKCSPGVFTPCSFVNTDCEQ